MKLYQMFNLSRQLLLEFYVVNGAIKELENIKEENYMKITIEKIDISKKEQEFLYSPLVVNYG